MNRPVYLDAFAALLPSGIYSHSGILPWRDDQHGPHDVSREQVLDKPYPGFGKLHIADRLAFGVAALALGRCEDRGGNSSGITLGIPSGSLSTDLRYRESMIAGFPSPAAFSATLPSSPLADISIYFGFKGPSRVISGDNASGLCAFQQALTLLRLHKAATVLVLSIVAVDPVDRRSPLVPPSLAKDNRAVAFLLTSIKSRAGLTIVIDARFDVPDKKLPDVPGEPYFDALVTMLSSHQTGSVSFATQGYRGFISIEKDL